MSGAVTELEAGREDCISCPLGFFEGLRMGCAVFNLRARRWYPTAGRPADCPLNDGPVTVRLEPEP